MSILLDILDALNRLARRIGDLERQLGDRSSSGLC